MKKVKEVRVVRKRTNCIMVEDNKVYCAEFRVGSAPEKEGKSDFFMTIEQIEGDE